MKSHSNSLQTITSLMGLGILLLANASCSTGVFFADDDQEGLVGYISATRYASVSDVLIVEKGTAPKLLIFDEPVVEVAAVEDVPLADPAMEFAVKDDALIFRASEAEGE